MVKLIVKKVVAAERMKICNACPQQRYTFLIGKTCGVFLQPVDKISCGCKLSVKTKLDGFSCPQNKW